LSNFSLSCLPMRRPAVSTLFPYTTLFRSRPEDRERARDAAMRVAERIGVELELPVFLYADLARGRGPAFFRRGGPGELQRRLDADRKSTRLNSSHVAISYAVFCLKKKKDQ